MAEQSKPISEFTEATSIPIGSLLFASLEDIDSETGYASYYVKTETLAEAIATQYTFSGLATDEKTLIGAINSLVGGSGGATVYVGTTDPSSSLGDNGNLYAKYVAGTPPTVSAFYVKISGSWASITTGGGGLIGVELTQAQYDALTPEEKTNGTVYFITDTDVPSVLDDYQTKEDSELETTSQEVVGAINELNSAISVKQDSMSHGALSSGSNFNNATIAGYYSFSGSSYTNPPDTGAIYGILHVMVSAQNRIM